jgi:hypothetical protein
LKNKITLVEQNEVKLEPTNGKAYSYRRVLKIKITLGVSLFKWLKNDKVFGGFIFWNSRGLVVKWFQNGSQIGKEVVLVQST